MYYMYAFLKQMLYRYHKLRSQWRIQNLKAGGADSGRAKKVC